MSLAGAIILLATSNLLRNIRGCLVIVVLSLDIYVYFNGWSMASNGRPSCVLYQHQSLAIPAIIALPLDTSPKVLKANSAQLIFTGWEYLLYLGSMTDQQIRTVRPGEEND